MPVPTGEKDPIRLLSSFPCFVACFTQSDLCAYETVNLNSGGRSLGFRQRSLRDTRVSRVGRDLPDLRSEARARTPCSRIADSGPCSVCQLQCPRLPERLPLAALKNGEPSSVMRISKGRRRGNMKRLRPSLLHRSVALPLLRQSLVHSSSVLLSSAAAQDAGKTSRSTDLHSSADLQTCD